MAHGLIRGIELVRDGDVILVFDERIAANGDNGSSGFSHINSVGLGHGEGHHGLLGMQAILSLIDDHRLRPIQDSSRAFNITVSR
jgi:hypothetical protein